MVRTEVARARLALMFIAGLGITACGGDDGGAAGIGGGGGTGGTGGSGAYHLTFDVAGESVSGDNMNAIYSPGDDATTVTNGLYSFSFPGKVPGTWSEADTYVAFSLRVTLAAGIKMLSAGNDSVPQDSVTITVSEFVDGPGGIVRGTFSGNFWSTGDASTMPVSNGSFAVLVPF